MSEEDVTGPVEALPEPVVAPDEPVLATGEGAESPKKKKKKKKKSAEGFQGSARGIETMFRTAYRTNMDLSSLADTKANIMISINGIIISILLAAVSPKIDSNPFLLIPTLVLVVSCLVSIIYAVFAARPRVSGDQLTREEVLEDRKNILFFGNFMSMSEDTFLETMLEMMNRPESPYINMIRDIYGLGRVLQKKFKLLRASYTTFMVGLILGVFAFFAAYTQVLWWPSP